MATNSQQLTEELIELYIQAQKDIIKRIEKKIKSGKFVGYDAGLIKDINRVLADLQTESIEWTNENVPKIYNQSKREVKEFFKANSIETALESSFVSVNQEAIKVLQDNLKDSLKGIKQQIGRNVDDIFRKETLKIVQKANLQGITRKEQTQQLINSLNNKQIFSFTDSAGRKWAMEDYATMAVRTTSTAASNQGTFNQTLEFENDLVMCSYHSTSCPVCAPYQNRVYSISGKSKKYPPLSVINNGNVVKWNVIHVNCRHRFTPYIPHLDDDREQTENRSNKEFTDNRSEWSKTRYKNRQKINVWNREKRKLRQERGVLKALPNKTIEQQDRLKDINSRIRTINSNTRDIKDWEQDSMAKGVKLFID